MLKIVQQYSNESIHIRGQEYEVPIFIETNRIESILRRVYRSGGIPNYFDTKHRSIYTVQIC